MTSKILSIVNNIRAAKELPLRESLKETDRLREDLELTSFDLAELTVCLEDEFGIDVFEGGLVHTVGEILNKLERDA